MTDKSQEPSNQSQPTNEPQPSQPNKSTAPPITTTPKPMYTIDNSEPGGSPVQITADVQAQKSRPRD